MNNKKYLDAFLDCNIEISDEEIKKLADNSKTKDGIIRENEESGVYYMTIFFENKSTKTEDSEIIIATRDRKEYKIKSTEFFKKFLKYGGIIDLKDIFV